MSWGQLARHLEDVHLQSGGDPQTKILHKFGAGNDEQTLVNHGMAMRVGVAAPLRTLRHVVSANPGGFSSGTCMPARQRHPLSFLVAASSPPFERSRARVGCAQPSPGMHLGGCAWAQIGRGVYVSESSGQSTWMGQGAVLRAARRKDAR